MLGKFFTSSHPKLLSRRAQISLFILGLGFVGLGLNQILYEKSKIPLCSREVLEKASQDHLLTQNVLKVAIDGAVVSPGIYELLPGSRVSEALNSAEGLAAQADRVHLAKNFNLAEKLVDGQKIYIPFEGEFDSPDEGQAILGEIQNNQTNKISINSSALEELDSLPGIGEARATKIMENRPYTSLDELVSGGVITEGIFEQIKTEIVL